MPGSLTGDAVWQSAITEFSLVRHGQTNWNLQRRIQGRTDIPLNDTGMAEALAAAARLKTRNWDAIVTSPLQRATQSAQIIARELGVTDVTVIPALTERHHGRVEGLTFAERQQRYPAGVLVPGLESRQDVAHRVLAALSTLAERRAGQRVLILSHGGIIGTLLRHVTDGERPRRGELIDNGSVHDFQWQNDRLLLVQFDSRTDSPGMSTEGPPPPLL